MSWKQIPAGRRRSSVGVAMALRFGAGGAQCKKRMVFVYLGEDVVERLQWNKDTRVAVFLGDGEHADKLRIAQAADDAMKLRSVGGQAKYAKLGVVFPPPPNVADETRNSQSVQYEIRNDGIEIVLPGWARTGAALPPVLRPQPQQVKPAPVMRDVTSALMGDPQPGRSAADQRGAKGAR